MGSREKEKTYKNKPKTAEKILIGTVHADNCLEWIKRSNQKTDWRSGYKNKTHLFAVYKRPTSGLGTHTE